MMGPDFRMDVARWIVPGEIGDPDQVTPKLATKLLYRHMGLRAVLALRIGKWCKRKGIPGATGFVQRLIYRRYGLDIVVGSPMGGGLYIAHPIGTTFSPAVAGENVSLIAAITVGMRNEHAFPAIGDRVFIGAGARVLGGIRLGDDARIGANAVVIRDVTENTSVGGIPARPIGSAQPQPVTQEAK